MAVKRSNEPAVWSLFSAGGVLSAMLMPAHVLLFGLAIPLGLVSEPSYEGLRELAGNPITRIYLFALCTFSFWHWAHRFRFATIEGLQLKSTGTLIAVVCYLGAIVGTVTAGYLAWNL